MNENAGPQILNSFEDAEAKLSDKDGIVLSGVGGDITDIEEVIKGIPHTEAYILITDQSGHVPSAWKSDVFLVGAKKEGETSIKYYFDEEWTDPAGGTHGRGEDDPAAQYESMKNIKTFDELNEGTMISKRNMDLEAFKHQGSFFNREPHSNDSPVHDGKSMKDLNEERSGDLLMELTNVVSRYKTKMDPEAIYDVLHLLAERQKNEF
jgi:hypothetical protein